MHASGKSRICQTIFPSQNPIPWQRKMCETDFERRSSGRPLLSRRIFGFVKVDGPDSPTLFFHSRILKLSFLERMHNVNVFSVLARRECAVKYCEHPKDPNVQTRTWYFHSFADGPPSNTSRSHQFRLFLCSSSAWPLIQSGNKGDIPRTSILFTHKLSSSSSTGIHVPLLYSLAFTLCRSRNGRT